MQKMYKTERLILKVLNKTYAKLILDYYLRNKDFLDEWEPTKNKDFYTISYHKNQLNNIKNDNSFRIWIFKKNDTQKIIGSISFSNIVRGAFLSCHLGYKLDKDEINNGYMTEALKKSINIIFNEFSLHRIEANIIPKNIRSLKVTQKLGFYNEGLAYKYIKINGKWEDHIHMVLLNDNI